MKNIEYPRRFSCFSKLLWQDAEISPKNAFLQTADS